MHTTPISLLEQLRQPADPDAWRRFVQLYTPLLFHWARRLGVQPTDTADLVQDVFVVLVRTLPELHYDRNKSFRAWLRTVVLNQWRDQLRRGAAIPQTGASMPPDLASPDPVDELTETEYRQQLAVRALQLMREEFEPSTWQACWEIVVNGRPALEVAQALGITVNAAYLAKSRVLSRLRQAMAGLLD